LDIMFGCSLHAELKIASLRVIFCSNYLILSRNWIFLFRKGPTGFSQWVFYWFHHQVHIRLFVLLRFLTPYRIPEWHRATSNRLLFAVLLLLVYESIVIIIFLTVPSGTSSITHFWEPSVK
jgi:hypothetical protein